MVAVFFYGLFMDAELLRARGVTAAFSTVARLEGYRLSIGERATLVPARGCTVHGILMHLLAEDLERLYSQPSVQAYRAKAVSVVLRTGEVVEAICYNLPPLHRSMRPNPAYASQLSELATRLNLPEDYVASIRQKGALLVRAEQGRDREQVHALNSAAFPSAAEADLVDILRARASPFVSLVAESERRIVGHIFFSPVSIAEAPGCRLMGLAPMAVDAAHRNRGVGSALVTEGLEACRQLGVDGVIVLGHPAYYPRFGFSPAERWGIRCEYDVPTEAFMVMELGPGVLNGVSGMARYHEAFSNV